MKKFLICCSFVLILASKAQAILPPYYESVKEIQSIISSPELAEIIGSGEPILSIERNDKGYEIDTNRYRIQVDLTYKSVPMPGPATYTLKFHEKTILIK